jgi:hypothetical protein
MNPQDRLEEPDAPWDFDVVTRSYKQRELAFFFFFLFLSPFFFFPPLPPSFFPPPSIRVSSVTIARLDADNCAAPLNGAVALL